MKNLKLRIVFTSFIMSFYLGSSHGQEISDYDKFSLWNDCQAINLVINVDKEVADASLSVETVKTSVRSRLRAARLYTEEDYRDDGLARPLLYVNVTSIDRAFRIDFQFNKWTFDPLSDFSSFAAITWKSGSTGVGGSTYIFSTLSQYTDQFIDEYLRVNAEAC